MGSAVSNLVGGGGGGLLGAIGGAVGTAFGGPIGGMIGSAVGNMLQEAIGSGVKDAVNTLQQEAGMPKFLANAVVKMVDDKINSLKNNSVDAGTQQAAQTQFGGSVESFRKDFTQALVDAVKANLKNDGASEQSGSSKGSSGGSWMQAIAKAMGEVMGQKASRMVQLSQEIAQKAGGTSSGSDADKMKAAADTQKLNTEFQATGQEFNLLQTTFSTTIKTLGEGMSSIARKQ